MIEYEQNYDEENAGFANSSRIDIYEENTAETDVEEAFLDENQILELDTLFSKNELADIVSTLSRARDHLLSLQDPKGYWKGELETNVSIEAEDIFLRTYLKVANEQDNKAAANWIRKQQRQDGTWANYYGGPGDLSTTVEAYAALKIIGDSSEEPHMKKATKWILEQGGLENARVFTQIWLSLFGLWKWEDLPTLPVEIMLIPSFMPLSIYDFGCWARQTVVALSMVSAYRPVRPIDITIEEIRTYQTPPQPKAGIKTWAERFALLDIWLRRLEKHMRKPIWRKTVREFALRKAERWVIRRQEADGGWGGIQPPWVYSILALHLRGYPLNHPIISKAFEGLESFTIHDGDLRRMEACQSPIWDTALSIIALNDAGIARNNSQLQKAASWLLSHEVTTRGDWSVRRSNTAPGGWAFEFENDNYPDVDDTAEVVLALRKVDLGTADEQTLLENAIKRAVTWSQGLCSAEGAWGAFDADNQKDILYQLPFCDFGAVIDPPSADVTAHMIEMLSHEKTADVSSIQKGIDWLLDNQEEDGSFYGRWGVNYIYGTGAAIPALIESGMSQKEEPIQKAIEYLVSHQNPDGGWGEDIRSYDDKTLSGQGHSTPSQTAWALTALIAAGESLSESVKRGLLYLVKTQLPNGTWDELYFTGTGFPGDFYINYHLYRLVFPVSALGRWCNSVGVAPPPSEFDNKTLGDNTSLSGSKKSDTIKPAKAKSGTGSMKTSPGNK